MGVIGGGQVRYVGIELAPGSGEPGFAGECLHGGSIELVVDGRVLESFDVAPGERVRVADGETVAAGQPLTAPTHGRNLRAVLPDGVEAVVHFPDPRQLDEGVDPVTGLSRYEVHLRNGLTSMPIELRDDANRVLATLVLFDAMSVRVREGQRVVCGDVLASWTVVGRERRSIDGTDSLRRYLDARTPWGRPGASAPFDGEIERVEHNAVVLRGVDGRTARLRTQAGARLHRPRDRVRAGDPLEYNHRSHHRLLRAWDAPRLAEHLLDELDHETRLRALDVPRVYWSLLVRAMLAWRRVTAPGDTGLRRHQVLAVDALARVQDATIARGGAPATVVPVLRGLATMARIARD